MRHGVGILDHIEDRIVGLKVRDIYEVPAAAIILKAHKELERLTGTIHQNQFKPRLDQKWAYLVYAGLWWEPLREDLEAYVEHVNRRVTGTIGLKTAEREGTVLTATLTEMPPPPVPQVESVPAQPIRRAETAEAAPARANHRNAGRKRTDGRSNGTGNRRAKDNGSRRRCSASTSRRRKRGSALRSAAATGCHAAAARRPRLQGVPRHAGLP